MNAINRRISLSIAEAWGRFTADRAFALPNRAIETTDGYYDLRSALADYMEAKLTPAHAGTMGAVVDGHIIDMDRPTLDALTLTMLLDWSDVEIDGHRRAA
jgi:hypothetical protein